MKICKECNSIMVEVMSFFKNKNEKFNRCPKCHSETKHRKIDDKDLVFEELFQKELHK